MTQRSLAKLLRDVRACTLCAQHLPLGPRPVLRASTTAKLLIVGQAPGTRVHASGIPWDDASGNRLREWLQLDRDVFYDETRVAIVPMGLCYPGRAKSGDLPPRPECARTWHAKLLKQMPAIELTLLVGQYAQAHFLGDRRRATLTETVRAHREYCGSGVSRDGRTLRACFPLPHPSPRNVAWFKANPWFERDVLPGLRGEVARLL